MNTAGGPAMATSNTLTSYTLASYTLASYTLADPCLRPSAEPRPG